MLNLDKYLSARVYFIDITLKDLLQCYFILMTVSSRLT